MKRRRLFNILAAVSLVMCVLFVIAGIVSLITPVWSIRWNGKERAYIVTILSGKVHLITEPTDALPKSLWMADYEGRQLHDWTVLTIYREDEGYYMRPESQPYTSGEIAHS